MLYDHNSTSSIVAHFFIYSTTVIPTQEPTKLLPYGLHSVKRSEYDADHDL
jgi:hypothetical protein